MGSAGHEASMTGGGVFGSTGFHDQCESRRALRSKTFLAGLVEGPDIPAGQCMPVATQRVSVATSAAGSRDLGGIWTVSP